MTIQYELKVIALRRAKRLQSVIEDVSLSESSIGLVDSESCIRPSNLSTELVQKLLNSLLGYGERADTLQRTDIFEDQQPPPPAPAFEGHDARSTLPENNDRKGPGKKSLQAQQPVLMDGRQLSRSIHHYVARKVQADVAQASSFDGGEMASFVSDCFY